MGCFSSSQRELASGKEDRPGCASLPQFHRNLYIGNEVAAAVASYPFDAVISTAPPVDQNGEEATGLTTHAIHFNDMGGGEDKTHKRLARKKIVQGAQDLRDCLVSGKRTLVHCTYGQNRSAAVCCAYAVLYADWSGSDAIHYVRSRAKSGGQRHYASNRGVLYNEVFCDIIMELAEDPQNAPSAFLFTSTASTRSVTRKQVTSGPCACGQCAHVSQLGQWVQKLCAP